MIILIHRQRRSPFLAAARSQNGSCVINAIHFRSAAEFANGESPSYLSWGRLMRYMGRELDRIRILGKVVSGQYKI